MLKVPRVRLGLGLTLTLTLTWTRTQIRTWTLTLTLALTLILTLTLTRIQIWTQSQTQTRIRTQYWTRTLIPTQTLTLALVLTLAWLRPCYIMGLFSTPLAAEELTYPVHSCLYWSYVEYEHRPCSVHQAGHRCGSQRHRDHRVCCYQQLQMTECWDTWRHLTI